MLLNNCNCFWGMGWRGHHLKSRCQAWSILISFSLFKLEIAGFGSRWLSAALCPVLAAGGAGCILFPSLSLKSINGLALKVSGGRFWLFFKMSNDGKNTSFYNGWVLFLLLW